MANAKRDGNRVETILLTSNADGVTPIYLKANASTGEVLISDGTTGTYLSDGIADRDENRVGVLMAVSSVDGSTPVAVYGDPATGALLTQST